MEGNGIKELRDWVARNMERFEGYSIEDIGYLAIACGFDRSAVAQWQTSRKFKEAI